MTQQPMSTLKKILALTTIRSDYDLMSPLYRLLHADPEMDFRLLVAGAHLAPTFGRSVREIEEDGFPILARFETLLDSDSKAARLKSASMLLQNAIDVVSGFDPDLLLYVGDREDSIIGALLGGYLEIPSLHFYGGDHVQDGYIDNPVRHAVSKLSTSHFVTLEQHKHRLMRLGEAPERIFVVGNIALDRLTGFVPLPLEDLQKAFGKPTSFDNFALVLHHPIAEERESAAIHIHSIIAALRARGLRAFIGYPNSDPGNLAIRQAIDALDGDDVVCYKNLPRRLFLSIYKRSQFIIGNSSSGICEAASMPVPAINVGRRQTGRFAGPNVIFCETAPAAIGAAIDKAMSREFREVAAGVSNPYGDGHSAQRAYNIIAATDFKPLLPKWEDPLEMEHQP